MSKREEFEKIIREAMEDVIYIPHSSGYSTPILDVESKVRYLTDRIEQICKKGK